MTATCTNCGTDLAPDWEFCQSCGTPVGEGGGAGAGGDADAGGDAGGSVAAQPRPAVRGAATGASRETEEAIDAADAAYRRRITTILLVIVGVLIGLVVVGMLWTDVFAR